MFINCRILVYMVVFHFNSHAHTPCLHGQHPALSLPGQSIFRVLLHYVLQAKTP